MAVFGASSNFNAHPLNCSLAILKYLIINIINTFKIKSESISFYLNSCVVYAIILISMFNNDLVFQL